MRVEKHYGPGEARINDTWYEWSDTVHPFGFGQKVGETEADYILRPFGSDTKVTVRKNAVAVEHRY